MENKIQNQVDGINGVEMTAGHSVSNNEIVPNDVVVTEISSVLDKNEVEEGDDSVEVLYAGKGDQGARVLNKLSITLHKGGAALYATKGIFELMGGSFTLLRSKGGVFIAPCLAGENGNIFKKSSQFRVCDASLGKIFLDHFNVEKSARLNMVVAAEPTYLKGRKGYKVSKA